jgi:hypothetical protein
MAESEVSMPRKRKKWFFPWLVEILYKPGQVFKRVSEEAESTWLTPLFVYTLTTLFLVILQGSIRQAAVLSGEIQYPTGFEFYTPEQQAQFLKALESTSSPVFTYVLPAIAQLAGIWLGWMIVGGLLHLTLTLLGGRGNTSISISLVAWSSVPFIIRDVVRILYVLVTDQLIQMPGISGFAPASETQFSGYATQFLSLVDIYLIWHIILLMIGARIATHISKKKAFFGVLVTMLAVISVQALIIFGISLLSNLTVSRPFFF